MTKTHGRDKTVFHFFILLGLIVGAIYLGKYLDRREGTHLVVVGACALFVLFLFLSMRRGIEFRKKLIAVTISSLFSVYLCETLLLLIPATENEISSKTRADAARKRGVAFDSRQRWEVLRDLNSTGEQWHPYIAPIHLLEAGKLLNIGGKEVLPLGSISEANIVDDNENGYFSTATTDELGFNNPRGIWQDRSRLDVAFAGDSFTNGCCVHQQETFVGRVREQIPRTITLGSSGNGPLAELATIGEYLRDYQLGMVFWMYFEGNDLKDLNTREANQPILMSYLEDESFSQGIKLKQKAIDSALIQVINEANAKRLISDRSNIEKESTMKDFIFDRVSLLNTRKIARRVKSRLTTSDLNPGPVRFEPVLFSRVMVKAKELVERGGGKLVFVYLPEYGRYDGNKYQRSSGAPFKNDVLNLINSLDIDVLDIDQAFKRLDDPKTMFPFRLDGHYNAEGNSVVAQQILDYLSGNTALLKDKER